MIDTDTAHTLIGTIPINNNYLLVSFITVRNSYIRCLSHIYIADWFDIVLLWFWLICYQAQRWWYMIYDKYLIINWILFITRHVNVTVNKIKKIRVFRVGGIYIVWVILKIIEVERFENSIKYHIILNTNLSNQPTLLLPQHHSPSEWYILIILQNDFNILMKYTFVTFDI